MAVELLRRGFAVTLFAPPSASAAVAVEAIPDHGARLFHALGLGVALRRAGAVAVRGFENAWESSRSPQRIDGIWVHVERSRLARALLDEAIARGTHVLSTDALPSLGRPEAGPSAGPKALFQWEVGGSTVSAFAAVDATGRVARWSRPIRRAPGNTAALYRGPGSAAAMPGRVARISGGFAYRIAHPDHTTVGVVLAGRAAPEELSEEAAAVLAIRDRRAFALEARRAAHPQWSEEPIRGRRLAVGDAALAYSPLAGQGLRFAVASALAASTALSAFREGSDEEATDYYRNFVVSARARHLSRLEQIEGATHAAAMEPPLSPLEETWVRFDARTRMHAVNRSGRLTSDEVVVLADGGLVRWLGGFDLLILRDLAGQARRMDELCAELGGTGLSPGEGAQLLHWCLRSGLLTRCAAPE
jgi:flavin-dependent dehydrogenase